ncbi:MAG TPA: MerR family transcriptional regulator [Polyangia bacterium]
MDVPAETLTMLKVGELARRTGKTTRAIHLYEELGLLSPAVRSKGGFRLYSARAVARLEWIQKLQDMGFSLTEIKAFLSVWEASDTAPAAMATVRAIFEEKLRETKATITRLSKLTEELQESLTYLESCKSCEPVHTQPECGQCAMHGHAGKAPSLVDGLSKM